MNTFTNGIQFDVNPGINSGVEVDARLLIFSHTTGQHEEIAKAEAAELIRRQILGSIEDSINADLDLFSSVNMQDPMVAIHIQASIIVSLNLLLAQLR